MQNISAALVKAQRAFAPALKTKANPHLKSRYADLAACVEAVIDALNANGIALIQKTHMTDDGVIVETVFLHESGESMSGGLLHVPAAKQDPQGYGSALTYARRYSLMAAAGIAPEDDDGTAGTVAKSGPAPSEFEQTHLETLRNAAMEGIDALQAAFAKLPAGAEKKQLWAKHQAALKDAAKKATETGGK